MATAQTFSLAFILTYASNGPLEASVRILTWRSS